MGEVLHTLNEIKAMLERRAAFVRGVKALTVHVQQCADGRALQIMLPLVTRVNTLLQTRHTSLESWQTGLQLFLACQSSSHLPDTEQQRLQTYVMAARAFIHQADPPEPQLGPQQPLTALAATTAQPSSATVGLASVAGRPDAAGGADADLDLDPIALLQELRRAAALQPAVSYHDDAGVIVDDPQRWQAAQQARGTRAGVRGSQAMPAPDTEAVPAPQPQGRSAARAELQRQILEGLNAVYLGMEAVTQGTEAIERELDLVLGSLQARSNKPKVPPMSKRVLASLPELVVTEQDMSIHKLQDASCPVCTDSIRVGDRVIRLPCTGQHWFHPDCVTPWLAKTNTCPACRHELPTDDHNYEAYKEKEQERAVEARGAANALTHDEFMYT